ncbi:MAG: glucosaminidase domain-containing protein [Fusobacteriota bacterium]
MNNITVTSKKDVFINNNETIKPNNYFIKDLNLNELPVHEKKEIFINLLLPSIAINRKILNDKKEKLIKIDQKIKSKQDLTKKEKQFLEENLKRYNIKNKDIKDLITRINPHTTSIALGQAIIETGWGTSRFFRKANNAFGLWSYNENEPRIKASETRGDQKIYLKKYDYLFESVEDYFYRIATVKMYSDFRQKRLSTDDYKILIPELESYSELRMEYVKRLESIISYNKLYKYDEYKLDI